ANEAGGERRPRQPARNPTTRALCRLPPAPRRWGFGPQAHFARGNSHDPPFLAPHAVRPPRHPPDPPGPGTPHDFGPRTRRAHRPKEPPRPRGLTPVLAGLTRRGPEGSPPWLNWNGRPWVEAGAPQPDPYGTLVYPARTAPPEPTRAPARPAR